MRDPAMGAAPNGGHSRTNSRRGSTNPLDRSYPPVNAVCRALHILRIANQRSIATVNALHLQTGIPRPTIVRRLTQGVVGRTRSG